MKRIAILISGRGSNMEALVHAVTAEPSISTTEALLVLANRPDAAGLEFAAKSGIHTAAIDHAAYATREAHEEAVHQQLLEHQTELVLLAGYMRILTAGFVTRWRGRLINIHPSLLPRYPGLDTHQRALDAGDLQAGASVHFVTEELDGGPVIVQSVVDIQPQETADSLADRVLKTEHIIYPMALQWLLDGRVELTQNRCMIDGTDHTSPYRWYQGQVYTSDHSNDILR